MLTPTTEEAAAEAVRGAIARQVPLVIRGAGTRSGLGRPVQAGDTLSLAHLSGVTLHEPAEMVISARAGTPLRMVEETLAAKGQMLPFEPMDHRLIYGSSGEPTIGGVVAANVSGPRRVAVGAARDHLIGVRFVNGLGEIIKSGGRVMKNVTGLDLVKLQAGAHGTLGVLTEVTFKVIPRPEASLSLVFEGLADARAITVMAAGLGSPFEISGAAHLPAGLAGPVAQTVLRLENFVASLAYRVEALTQRLAEFGRPRVLEQADSETLWVQIRDVALLAEPRDTALWRLSIKTSEAPHLVQQLQAAHPAARVFYDWGGGLVWLALPAERDAGSTEIREAIAGKGHATLVRAPDAVRTSIAVFEPEAAPVAALTRRIKASFDPLRLINPGRMIEGA
jgi:glycolate oxidase FAD binding subunit